MDGSQKHLLNKRSQINKNNIYDIREQAKLIYSDKSKKALPVEKMRMGNWMKKKTKRTFGGDRYKA